MKINPDIFEHLGVAALEIAVGMILGPLVRALIMRMSRKAWDKGALTFIASFCNIAILASAIVVALEEIGVHMTLIVGAFSALGLGLSLALKDNVANVACGLQILLTRPFVVGDYIKVNGHEGTVKEIDLMYCLLVESNLKEVIVPNTKIIHKSLVNYSRQPNRRISIKVPVYRYHDVDDARARIMAVVTATKDVLSDPEPYCALTQIHKNYVVFKVRCYTKYPNYYNCKYALGDALAKLEEIKG